MSNKEYDHLLYQLARIGEVFTQETERMPVKKKEYFLYLSQSRHLSRRVR